VIHTPSRKAILYRVYGPHLRRTVQSLTEHWTDSRTELRVVLDTRKQSFRMDDRNLATFAQTGISVTSPRYAT